MKHNVTPMHMNKERELGPAALECNITYLMEQLKTQQAAVNETAQQLNLTLKAYNRYLPGNLK